MTKINQNRTVSFMLNFVNYGIFVNSYERKRLMFFKQKTDPNKIIAAGVVGALLGAVAGMLLAPKSGKDTRKTLRDWSEDMGNTVKDRLQKTKDAAQDKYNQVAEAVAEKKDKVDTIKENEVSNLGEDLKGRWENVKEEWKK